MAEVTKETRPVTVEQSVFVLVLTEDEANMLYDVTRRTGGRPYETRRGLMDKIGAALSDAGVNGTSRDDIRQSLKFGSEPQQPSW